MTTPQFHALVAEVTPRLNQDALTKPHARCGGKGYLEYSNGPLRCDPDLNDNNCNGTGRVSALSLERPYESAKRLEVALWMAGYDVHIACPDKVAKYGYVRLNRDSAVPIPDHDPNDPEAVARAVLMALLRATKEAVKCS